MHSATSWISRHVLYYFQSLKNRTVLQVVTGISNQHISVTLEQIHFLCFLSYYGILENETEKKSKIYLIMSAEGHQFLYFKNTGQKGDCLLPLPRLPSHILHLQGETAFQKFSSQESRRYCRLTGSVPPEILIKWKQLLSVSYRERVKERL